MTYVIEWKCQTSGFQTENTITIDDIEKHLRETDSRKNIKEHLDSLGEKQIKTLLMICLCGQLNKVENWFADVPWDRDFDPMYLSHRKVVS